MLIDIHTHAYADEIAERAMNALVDTAKITYCTNGTIGDLKTKLKGWGIDYGVMLMVATKPTQQTKINNWAAEVQGGNIFSFGTVHPEAPDVIDELERIKALGLKGVKFHPDYQGFFLFEDRIKPIYKRCEELGLPIIFHMGFDPVSPVVHHAMPYHLIGINREFPKLKLIGAHLGGMMAWDEVLHYVCGLNNVWLDTAYTADFIKPELMTEIIRKHGVDKILFGSDCPWHEPTQEKALIDSLPLTDGEKEKIYWKNVVELLELEI